MILSWIFSLTLFGLGTFVLWRLLDTPHATWWSYCIAGGFALFGAVFIWQLARRQLHLRRLGPGHIDMQPRTVLPGEEVALHLVLERRDLGAREVVFVLEYQQPDDESGWTTLQSLTTTARLVAGRPTARATLRLPGDAPASRASSPKRRWLATARIEGLRLAAISAELDVQPFPDPGIPSRQSIVLSAASGTKDAAVAEAPPGAFQDSPGSWQWETRSRLLQAAGRALMVCAAVWLIITARTAMPALHALHTETPIGIWASLLFQVPFWVAGFVLALIGAALATMRQHAVVRHGSVEVSLHLLGKEMFNERVLTTQVQYLRATDSVRSNGRITRFGLLARQTSGDISIPLAASSMEELERYARWLAQVLGAPNLAFDPQVYERDRSFAGAQVDPRLLEQLSRLAQTTRWLQRILAMACALGFLGMLLLMASVMAQHWLAAAR